MWDDLAGWVHKTRREKDLLENSFSGNKEVSSSINLWEYCYVNSAIIIFSCIFYFVGNFCSLQGVFSVGKLITVTVTGIETSFSTWTHREIQKADLNGFVLYDKNSKSMRLQFLCVLIVLSSKAVSVQNENEDIKQTYAQ